MSTLTPKMQHDLERAVIDAREVSETGAANALAVFGVQDDRAPDSLSSEDRKLRVALRAQARSLGNSQFLNGVRELREEIAYAAWHRMLFARFLAENGLLIEPSSGVPVSMTDITEIARESGESDPWVLAARYAATMLPGIFATVDPTTKVVFAPDDRLRLEAILNAIPTEVFASDDALGWVYQFWQSKRKTEVNKAGDKVGGGDLAPSTQLFTEHYMVRFLLENSLGAWWAGRHPDSPLLHGWEYLRFRDDGTPAAGSFENWPERAAEITVMDPCMGSGHFLVAAADMLRGMRAEEDGLSPEMAAESVLRDNLYGLELDPRCTQIAAFALAFDAWRAAGRYLPLPIPNVACSGIAVKGQLDDWRRLAGTDGDLRAALERLYGLFQDAPDLGSLINPRSAAGEGPRPVDPDRLLAALERALARESDDPAAAVFGGAAEGTAKAARLLSGRYWLVATNPPFLGRDQQEEIMRRELERSHTDSRFDLAIAFVTRGLAMLHEAGVTAMVTPQNWFFLGSYSNLRCRLLANRQWLCLARLGPGAFVTPMWAFNVGLVILGTANSAESFGAIDVGSLEGPEAKARGLRLAHIITVSSALLAGRKGCAIDLRADLGTMSLLSKFATIREGLKPGQTQRVTRYFWEVPIVGEHWRRLSSSPEGVGHYSGNSEVIVDPRELAAMIPESNTSGLSYVGSTGVLMSKMGALPAALYPGAIFDNNTFIVSPKSATLLPAIWSLVKSPEFREDIRARYQKLDLTVSVVGDVPFDVDRWTKAAVEQYPNGLPIPLSNDPTQWLFKGSVVDSEAPLQVTVARLLGYRWPDQDPDILDGFSDPDGIVGLPSVSGDAPAAERLEKLLAVAYGSAWTPTKLAELLVSAGAKSTTLEAWLREEFFEQHARLFRNRPFIWHVWDGLQDGFSALIHYHRLDRPTLEKLTYAHLGDWLERQRAGVAGGDVGAGARLAAATKLQETLTRILEGESPLDIHVRWKSLTEQPLGWNPDLDDGVRLNIRPFITAGILRAKFTINWRKDRGKEPDGTERLNDLHFTLAEKRSARGKVG